MVEALTVAALLGLTVAVWMMVAQGDFWMRLHAPGMVHGLLLLLLAAAVAGGAPAAPKAALIGLFLVLTGPLSTHALARAHDEEA